ncbi:hypothetical protein VAE122_3040104 [Vibrio aestuarianus]|nr:hypothetical protein VAE122_3040104 [Vibrio aestuarianus]CAH8237036.1 hypothetical protein VAEU17_4400211 [Vibrio aestuarianus]
MLTLYIISLFYTQFQIETSCYTRYSIHIELSIRIYTLPNA